MITRNRNMTEGPLLGNILFYTFPIILTSLLQLFFNAADLVVVGRYCGSLSVAAVGATGSITGLVVNLFIGLSVGSGVTVAQGIGARDHDFVHCTIHTALPTALLGGLFLTVIGVIFSGQFLFWMGTPDTVLPLATVYMRIYFCGMVFSMVYNFCSSILRAAGDTKSPLIFLAISGVLNVLLNLFFVLVFNMNVAGVALATILSQALSAFLVVRALIHRTDSCQLILKNIRFYKQPLLKIIRIGLPAGLQSSLFAISNVLIQSSINSFGDVFMSGNAAAQNIEGFIYVIMNAFHQTAVNFTGQNVGAKKYRRTVKVLGICLICVIVSANIVSRLVYHFGPSLLSIYITDSAEAIAHGMTRFSYVCLPYFICGMMDVTTGSLRGMGASFIPMLLSILGVCGIRIGWVATVFQIPQYHTPECLFFSYPISWAATFLFQLCAFLILYRKRIRQNLTAVSSTPSA